MQTEAPEGQVMVYPRRIDLDNVEQLKQFEYTTVATSYQQLTAALADQLEWPNTACS